jgi:hypothetical protein
MSMTGWQQTPSPVCSGTNTATMRPAGGRTRKLRVGRRSGSRRGLSSTMGPRTAPTTAGTYQAVPSKSKSRET